MQFQSSGQPFYPLPPSRWETPLDPNAAFFVALRVFVALRGFLFFSLCGSLVDQRNAMGRMVKPAVLPLILLVAAM